MRESVSSRRSIPVARTRRSEMFCWSTIVLRLPDLAITNAPYAYERNNHREAFSIARRAASFRTQTIKQRTKGSVTINEAPPSTCERIDPAIAIPSQAQAGIGTQRDASKALVHVLSVRPSHHPRYATGAVGNQCSRLSAQHISAPAHPEFHRTAAVTRRPMGVTSNSTRARVPMGMLAQRELDASGNFETLCHRHLERCMTTGAASV